ncbi:hypothetical protein HDU76_005792 [Blyttiomyces sp. JEL0837]|nr:hypothetical protein HDU76_005792 [Blyttiomyces sp. JEL0837]
MIHIKLTWALLATSLFAIALVTVNATPSNQLQVLTKRDDNEGLPVGKTFHGSASYFGDGEDMHGNPDPRPFPPDGQSACGPNYIPTDKNYYAALSEDTFNSYSPDGDSYKNPICGQCAKVRASNGNEVYVPIIDACPGCGERGPYDLDLSHQAIADLMGDWSYGQFLKKIKWSIVEDCGDHGVSSSED